MPQLHALFLVHCSPRLAHDLVQLRVDVGHEVVPAVGDLAGVELLVQVTLDGPAPAHVDGVEVARVALLQQDRPVHRVEVHRDADFRVPVLEEEHVAVDGGVAAPVGELEGKRLAIRTLQYAVAVAVEESRVRQQSLAGLGVVRGRRDRRVELRRPRRRRSADRRGVTEEHVLADPLAIRQKRHGFPDPGVGEEGFLPASELVPGDEVVAVDRRVDDERVGVAADLGVAPGAVELLGQRAVDVHLAIAEHRLLGRLLLHLEEDHPPERARLAPVALVAHQLDLLPRPPSRRVAHLVRAGPHQQPRILVDLLLVEL